MTSLGGQTGYGLLSAIRRRAQGSTLQETDRQAAYYKYTAPGSPNRLTCTVTTSCLASLTNTHTLHTLQASCNGPIWTGLST